MAKYRMSVCRGMDCRAGGSEALLQRALAEVRERGLSCEVARGGCYGHCHHGPNVVVRPVDPSAPPDPFSSANYMILRTPGEAHYDAMNLEKLLRVIDEHLAADRTVEELLSKE